MWRYRNRVRRDLERWQEAGWVDAPGAEAIAADLEHNSAPFGYAGALAVLGAVLIGFAAMSFVAANWQDMPRLLRLAILFAVLWSSYVTAGVLAARNMKAFANAAVLLGVSAFGASIMLIAQMFHIEGNPPDAVLLWAAGALLAGILLTSTSALALAMLLVGLWAGWETSLRGEVFWSFLAGWGAVSAGYVWLNWRPGLHLAAAALAIFIVSLGYWLGDGHHHWLVVLIGLAGVALTFVVRTALPARFDEEIAAVLGYALAVAFTGAFALQFIEDIDVAGLIALAGLTLLMLLTTIYWGLHTQQRALIWLGYAGFSIEVLAIYFKTVGTLLGSSLFFLIAGLIVIALAAIAYRLHAQSDLKEAM